MKDHSASERSVGYLFLMRATVANYYSTHLFGQSRKVNSRNLNFGFTAFSEIRVRAIRLGFSRLQHRLMTFNTNLAHLSDALGNSCLLWWWRCTTLGGTEEPRPSERSLSP